MSRLSERQAAALLGVSDRTLRKKRLRGDGPPFERDGRRIAYCPQTLSAWIKSQRATATPRKAKPVMTAGRRKPVLPPRLVELLCAQLAHAHAGEPRVGNTAARHLAQALEPHERELALCLAPRGSVLPDGRVRLQVVPGMNRSPDELGPYTLHVPVTYDPRTAQYESPITAGLPGFAHLAKHVWYLQGDTEGLPMRRLCALIGMAYLAFLAEGGA